MEYDEVKINKSDYIFMLDKKENEFFIIIKKLFCINIFFLFKK